MIDDLLTMDDVLSVLKDSEREGTDTDVPEGSRYIQLSDSLVHQMVCALEAYDGAEELRDTAVKMKVTYDSCVSLSTDTVHDRHIKTQAYQRDQRGVYELASAVMEHFGLI